MVSGVVRSRDLKSEADELQEKEKDKDEFYETKLSEMEGFKEQVRGRHPSLRLKVQNLRATVSEVRLLLPSSFCWLHFPVRQHPIEDHSIICARL